MDRDVLVSMPQLVPINRVSGPATPADDLQPSSGLATAGYRSAKYSPPEWTATLRAGLQRAAEESVEAQRLQQLSRTLSRDTQALALRTQAEGTRRFGERLQETHGWRSELQQQIDALLAETELLVAQRRRLEKALDATDIPYAIATDNLTCRDRRPAPDLVRDPVEEELLKEVELVRNIQALLKKTLAQVVNQIKTNRDTKVVLELDWSDKHEAYVMDEQCGRYNNMSVDTQRQPSSATMHDHVSNPASWAQFTQNNLAGAAQENQASQNLRALVEQLLQEVVEDQRVQAQVVQEAFSQRCGQMGEARAQLETQLREVLQQVALQEQNIRSLQQAIQDKELPLRTAQARLSLRSTRPNMELCRDPPQLSLVGEVEELTWSLSELQQQLAGARSSLSRLQESRAALEKDLCCKSRSLFIDKEKCLGQRRHCPTLSTLSGY